MSRLFALPAGRRARWVIVAAWLAAMVVTFGANLPGRFADAENNESSSWLPGDAESTRALDATEQLTNGEQAGAVLVYRREGGLTAGDRERIRADVVELNRDVQGFDVPWRVQARSRDGTTVLVASSIRATGESDAIADPVQDVRDRVSTDDDTPAGDLQVKLTGAAGYSADAIKVFDQINGTLFGAAFLLVFVLLALIYRSPLLLWIPLISVGFAEMATRALGWALTEAGVTVNGQSSAILSVLVLGAGTDYALLLVARYREELRRHQSRTEAMERALRSAGPAIFASGLTVIAGLLCLSLAELNSTASLGPIGALGIAVAMVAMLTLLPALLVISPRRVFWPRIPRYGETGADETHGAWRAVAERVARSPRRVWMGALALLLVMAAGNAFYDSSLTSGNGFRGDVESVDGQELIARSFPQGANAPTEIVVPNPDLAPRVAAAVARAPGVAGVRPVARGEPGVLLDAILEEPPYSTAAFDLVPGIRDAAKGAGGDAVLVGGATAVEYDTRQSTIRDTRLIVPLTLLVVLLILIGLLRAVVAPLLLIGTVIVSFFAALGVGMVVFDLVFDFPGVEPSLPLYAFVFLVALGIDYNIFLMARVREETVHHGTRQGMLRGLAVTGGVITSAGIVLAGTFSVLAVLPLIFLTEIGFVIAFGVLLDTFVVRSILVPALVFDLGPPTWWPSTLAQSIERRRARGSAGSARAPTG
ncbi:MAG TPA: MMPL family transporter [Capillimicrobium sp.]|nr:MMPL family transporter [Capillimicrobium sp.]